MVLHPSYVGAGGGENGKSSRSRYRGSATSICKWENSLVAARRSWCAILESMKFACAHEIAIAEERSVGL